ncbi:hypothetical protein [Kitasatospora sp. NBC_01302]|uniref:hypothetical protein n=1 Tax=Kitasatospora sp. NBC_01302 TaxID=2903575 RepID=UPI002E0EA445|nr:hypothetical protein OG294_11480 [Kitasatospora sp. NBC_01302]
MYLDLLTHQVAAYHGSAPAWGGDVVNVVSADSPFQGEWPGARNTRVERVATDRPTLLADAHTREVVVAVLAESAGRD